MMFNVCLSIPSLYVPLLTLVTISFEFCLFIFSMAGVTVQVNRDTKILMPWSSSMWQVLHTHYSHSFFPGQLLLPWFYRTCGVVGRARKQQTRERAKPVILVCFLDRKRSWMPSNGWRRTGKNRWKWKDMTPYKFEVGFQRLRSSVWES